MATNYIGEETSNASILLIVMVMVNKGIEIIGTNLLYGAGLLVGGAVLLIVRAYLQKQGYEIGKSN